MSFKTSLLHFIGSHRFLNRKLRSFLPQTSTLKISNNFSLALDPKDLYGPSYYVMYGKAAAFYHYEEELKADIVQYLKRDGVFLDVGANIGLISFFVKKLFPELKIYSFEPGETVSTCFAQTIALNKLENIELVKKGVSDKSGTAEFFIDPKSTGGSSLTRKHHEKNNKNIERIELISLDDFISSTGVVPQLLKVDVEGHENKVLLGAQKLIRDHKPTIIIEADHKNMLDDLNLWQSTFAGYQFRPVGTHIFYSVDKLEAVVQARVKAGRSISDYLFVSNS